MTSPQSSFEFTPGLLELFPDFMDCVRSSVYSCGKQLKNIAAECDMSESGLSKRLSHNTDPDSKVHFPLEKLPALMRATGDTRPAQWLALSFLQDDEQRTRHAFQQIATLAPILANLLTQAGVTNQPTKARR